MPQKLPNFTQIKPETIQADLKNLLTTNKTTINNLLTSIEQPTWSNLIQPLDELSTTLHRYWSPIAHLHAVKDNPTLREAYNEGLLMISDYATELSHHAGLFHAIETLAKSDEFQTLSTSQKTVIEHDLRDFRLAGIHLPDEQKKHYAELQQSLTKLESQFEQHLLDASDHWVRHVVDVSELDGLPEYALNSAREEAQRRHIPGWVITLKAPSYLAIMQHAKHRNLREEIYTAYVARASDAGPHAGCWDNSTIMVEILKKRHEEAVLLGFNNYAELSLATKMAKTPTEVLEFLKNLSQLAKDAAKKEVDELRAFAKSEGFKEDLKPWDIAYYSEALRKKRYDFSQEELRPYFQQDRVLKGLFKLVQRLFSIRIEACELFDRWHEDVELFAIYDLKGNLRSYFYLDLYARSQKRGGAWMDDCQARRLNAQGEIETPIAFLTCNFSSPSVGQPALLDHDEIETLFHEFGHGLHHMLTQINEGPVSGIRGVAWDAVELPSQFMEHWCWQPEVLKSMSCHIETGEVLPDALINKLIASKNFQSALQLLRQNEFALFDFKLHMTSIEQSKDIQDLLDGIRQEYSVLPQASFNRFQHSFSHIFAGGYAAGYYSYKWAEVLASDAFGRFEEEGLFNEEIGQDFLQSILERGGSEDAMTLFIEFRKRRPTIDALLRHTGISNGK